MSRTIARLIEAPGGARVELPTNVRAQLLRARTLLVRIGNGVPHTYEGTEAKQAALAINELLQASMGERKASGKELALPVGDRT